MNTIPKKIQSLTHAIVNDFHPQKVILFGSWASGKPRPESDIDLFIVKRTTKRRIDRERELRSKLFGNAYPPLDLLVYTPQEVRQRIAMDDFFIQDIIKHGTILYES